MLERMQTGRLKVFRGQDQWMEEFRYYRREEGLIVKERDEPNADWKRSPTSVIGDKADMARTSRDVR